MNCTFAQILRAHLLDEDQENWPNYMLLKWLSILLSMLKSKKQYLKSFIVKESIVLTCYYLQNPPSTLMLISLLAR